MHTRTFRAFALAAPLLLAPVLASAHPGHGLQADLAAGLTHPVTGLDHLLVMLAVGAWAAWLGGAARWAVPGTFVAALLAGSLLPAAALGAGLVEHMIAASLLLVGVLLACAARPPLAVALTLVAAFAAFHGLAHGAEAPAGSAALYRAGFVASTLVLHAAGFVLGTLSRGRQAARFVRVAGAAAGVAGAGLLIG